MTTARLPRWHLPNELPRLTSGVVHVWRVELQQHDPDALQWEDFLPENERERASRFVVATPRRQFVAARAALRQLLARYLGRPARAIQFALGTYGKPRLAESNPLDLHFNVSHSGDMVLLAFALGREVGVDVEHLHQLHSRDEVAERFYAPPEAVRIQALPPERRDQAFFHHWVRKEAFVKAIGKGIASGLSAEVEVLAEADAPPPAACVMREPGASAPWRLLSFELGPEYLGAVSAAGEDWSPAFWAWPPPA